MPRLIRPGAARASGEPPHQARGRRAHSRRQRPGAERVHRQLLWRGFRLGSPRFFPAKKKHPVARSHRLEGCFKARAAKAASRVVLTAALTPSAASAARSPPLLPRTHDARVLGGRGVGSARVGHSPRAARWGRPARPLQRRQRLVPADPTPPPPPSRGQIIAQVEECALPSVSGWQAGLERHARARSGPRAAILDCERRTLPPGARRRPYTAAAALPGPDNSPSRRVRPALGIWVAGGTREAH